MSIDAVKLITSFCCWLPKTRVISMQYFIFCHSSLLVLRHWVNGQCPGSQLTLVTPLVSRKHLVIIAQGWPTSDRSRSTGCCNHAHSCILLTPLLLPACHNVNTLLLQLQNFLQVRDRPVNDALQKSQNFLLTFSVYTSYL